MEKNLDSKGRWRNKIVAFRVSPEEAEQIDVCVRLSGLSKQDYITKRLIDREIVVQGNPRVYKALRNQMAEIYEELKHLEKCSEENEELGYNSYNKRYGLLSSDLWIDPGFHCGECLEVLIDDQWVKTRMEMNLAREWYLAGTPYCGDLEYVRARIPE